MRRRVFPHTLGQDASRFRYALCIYAISQNDLLNTILFLAQSMQLFSRCFFICASNMVRSMYKLAARSFWFPGRERGTWSYMALPLYPIFRTVQPPSVALPPINSVNGPASRQPTNTTAVLDAQPFVLSSDSETGTVPRPTE